MLLDPCLRTLLRGGFFGIALSWQMVSFAAEPPAASVNLGTGWFTAEQALRGRTQYKTQCASCHADNMAGVGPAPPLAGGAFLAKWSASTVYDLLERVKTTMPQNAPRTLSEAAYADVVSFILRANNFPAGGNELSNDPERLRAMPLNAGHP
jgi:mono/diheme cytochrome c family protein